MMKRNVGKGKTLLVGGPASVNLLSGKVEVLGGSLKVGGKVVIRDGKSVPFKVCKKATFDLRLGENASFQEVNGTTIPSSWENAFREAVSHEKPVTVMVIGGVDSGKTSFCAYLANRVLKKGFKVAIIDGDLGQSDIGPPSTIGFSHVTRPTKDFFEMKVENAFFVGVTSPSLAVNKVIEVLKTLKGRVLRTNTDFLIVNTDGWIEGEDAAGYKIQLAGKTVPDIVVGIQQEEELTSILTALKEKRKVILIESSQVIRKRNRGKRKTLRELSYRKYLKEAKMHRFLLSQVRVKNAPAEPGDSLPMEQIKETELLVALQDTQENFLGIGILGGTDVEEQVVKVYTPVSENVSTIMIGKVKVNKEGRELD